MSFVTTPLILISLPLPPLSHPRPLSVRKTRTPRSVSMATFPDMFLKHISSPIRRHRAKPYQRCAIFINQAECLFNRCSFTYAVFKTEENLDIAVVGVSHNGSNTSNYIALLLRATSTIDELLVGLLVPMSND